MAEPDMNVINDVASKLGTDPEWLYKLISFESRFDPLIKNKVSSARGLIQVMDSTARDVFNVPDSLTLINKYPTFDTQMYNVVLPYLARYKPFPTKQSLYMAVFYPKYRYVDPTTEFPVNVQAVNPNIRVVQDYVNFVERKKITIPKKAQAPTLAIVLMVGAYLWYKTRKR